MTPYNIRKRLIAGCACSAILATFISCSLDENPRDQIPEEEAYTTTISLYLNTVATLYNYMGGSSDGQGFQGTCRGIYDLQTFGSDEAMLPTRSADWYDGGIWQDMYRHSWNPGHELFKNSWLYLYKVITLCNRSLEKLVSHSGMLEEDVFVSYISEVRGIRAICYWYLLDLFGRVPIVTINSVSMNEVKQSERSEVFKYIINEFKESYPYLPQRNSANAGEYYGRVTADVVNFVMAKLMLNAEVYADDDWTDNVRPDGSKMTFTFDGKNYNAWEATIHFCDLLEARGYILEPDYKTNFKIRNESSKENIWTIPVDKDLYTNQQQNLVRSWHWRHAAAYGCRGQNGTSATLKVLHVFGYGTPEQDNRFDINYWAGPVTDLRNMPVLDRTGNQLVYYPWDVEMNISRYEHVETAGARMKKYEVDPNATLEGALVDNDIVLFRFADVLLMRAEAKLRLGQDGQDDFDAVRLRVDMPKRKLTLDNILDERLMELSWEGWRRQDLIRFGQYKSLFEGDNFGEPVDETDNHTTVYPIPGDVMASNHNLTQNKGY